MERTVDEAGVKETTSSLASTVVSWLFEPEKTTRPLVVAIGVAEGGVDTGTAWVVGARVAVVRDVAGWMTPLLVDGGGTGESLLDEGESGVELVEGGSGLELVGMVVLS